MRTPLHAILGLAGMLRQGIRSGVPALELTDLLDALDGAGGKLLALIEDLLDLADLEHARHREAAQPFDLDALIDAAASAFRGAALAKGLFFDVDRDPGAAGWVVGHGPRLARVLSHLGSSAVRIVDSRRPALGVQREDALHVRFQVAETGDGIPGAELGQILSAVYSITPSCADRSGAAGVGFAMCGELVKSMGGTLHCDGQAAFGTTFVFRLPLPATDPPPVRPLPSNRTAADGKPSVLLAEDDDLNALIVQSMLAPAGVDVDRVADGAQAAELARVKAYDLILMDIQMPVMDGFTSARLIRKVERTLRRHPAPIIALTANSSAADRRRSREAGMDEHITKPFCLEQMSMLLSRYSLVR